MAEAAVGAEPTGVAQRRRRRSWAGVATAGIVLFVVYLGLSFLNHPDGTLSTDVGGKVATLDQMSVDGTTSPDVGYWAADWDPTASMHGFYHTTEIDGRYVNVTTLPIIELARPLYGWGGYRAALVWSMSGAVAASFAARALARRAGGGDRRAWAAFWLTGLASPVLLYALDLWEHAPGLALMAWGVVGMVDVAAGQHRWPALAAGVAFGAAYSMRTEAVAYGFVVVGIGCVLLWRRRGIVTAVVAGVAAAVGFVALVAANYALEVAVLGSSMRTGRASGAGSGGGTDLATRLEEALTTSVGLFPDTGTNALVVGALATGLLAWAVWRTSRPGDRTVVRVAVALALVLYAVRAVDGLGFVPGFAATTPFAVAGVVLAFDRRTASAGRDAVLMVGLALPVVWYFQYSGGAVPQWGGRYVLTTALVLSAVGVGASALFDRWMQYVLAGVSVAVALFGLAWMSYRTHEVARAADTVGAIDAPVVSVHAFWLRELGASYGPESEWLSVAGLGELDEALGVIDAAGRDRFVLLWAADPSSSPPGVAGWSRTGDGRVEDWLGVNWRLIEFQRSP